MCLSRRIVEVLLAYDCGWCYDVYYWCALLDLWWWLLVILLAAVV